MLLEVQVILTSSSQGGATRQKRNRDELRGESTMSELRGKSEES